MAGSKVSILQLARQWGPTFASPTCFTGRRWASEGWGGSVFWASTQEVMCCCLSITCSKQETGRTIVSELILKAQSTDLRATSTEFSSVQSTKCANPMIWQEHQTTHLLFTRVHRCKISWPLTRSDATSAEKSNSFLRHVLLGQKKTKNKKTVKLPWRYKLVFFSSCIFHSGLESVLFVITSIL